MYKFILSPPWSRTVEMILSTVKLFDSGMAADNGFRNRPYGDLARMVILAADDRMAIPPRYAFAQSWRGSHAL
jgi:hypothetical protein